MEVIHDEWQKASYYMAKVNKIMMNKSAMPMINIAGVNRSR
jgi:hypothetical protein